MKKTWLLLFCISLSSPAISAGEDSVHSALSYPPTQVAVYSQGLKQTKDTFLLLEANMASESLKFYIPSTESLYVDGPDILVGFLAKQPGRAIIQMVPENLWTYINKNLAPYTYPAMREREITLFCNPQKTQHITLKTSHKPADCTGCDYEPPYEVTWHDTSHNKTKKLPLDSEIRAESHGPETYAYCKGDIFYYESSVRADDEENYWCDVIRAHHISTGKDEIFVSLPAEKCGAKLSGPMAVPGTDYLLYQISDYEKSNTQLFMKKGLK